MIHIYVTIIWFDGVLFILEWYNIL